MKLWVVAGACGIAGLVLVFAALGEYAVTGYQPGHQLAVGLALVDVGAAVAVWAVR